MKCQLKVLWRAQQAFKKVFDYTYDDPKLSYALSKIAKKLNSEIEEIDLERSKLVSKYTKKDEEGKPITNTILNPQTRQPFTQIELTDMEAFNKDFQKLLEAETEFDIWQIPFKVLEIVKITPNENALIMDFIEELKEEPVATDFGEKKEK